MQAQTMVMNITSYDIMVKGAVLYPLGVTIDFGKKSYNYITHDDKQEIVLICFTNNEVHWGTSHIILQIHYVG
jgi:hypothetical protein